MTRLLLIAASLGFAVSGAAACDYLHSASNVDETKVASVSTDQAPVQNMSTPAPAATTDGTAVVVKKPTETTVPVDTE
jgi:hypothetical protein